MHMETSPPAAPAQETRNSFLEEKAFASRTVLGGIGMVACGSFIQDGHDMVVYESRRRTET